MGVMIRGNDGIWKESENVPMRYDPTEGVRVETNGRRNDGEAWEEVWSLKKILFDESKASDWEQYALTAADHRYQTTIPITIAVGQETTMSYTTGTSGGWERLYAKKNKVDFANYKKLKINIISAATNGGNIFAFMGITSELSNYFTPTAEYTIAYGATIRTGELEIDVTEIESGYVFLSFCGGQGCSATIKFDKIWLEK